jgi:hypothetical protein
MQPSLWVIPPLTISMELIASTWNMLLYFILITFCHFMFDYL